MIESTRLWAVKELGERTRVERPVRSVLDEDTTSNVTDDDGNIRDPRVLESR